jgi:hypothetical protein
MTMRHRAWLALRSPPRRVGNALHQALGTSKVESFWADCPDLASAFHHSVETDSRTSTESATTHSTRREPERIGLRANYGELVCSRALLPMHYRRVCHSSCRRGVRPREYTGTPAGRGPGQNSLGTGCDRRMIPHRRQDVGWISPMPPSGWSAHLVDIGQITFARRLQHHEGVFRPRRDSG